MSSAETQETKPAAISVEQTLVAACRVALLTFKRQLHADELCDSAICGDDEHAAINALTVAIQYYQMQLVAPDVKKEPKVPGWDGTCPNVDEYNQAAMRCIRFALASGNGQHLRDIKLLMDFCSEKESRLASVART